MALQRLMGMVMERINNSNSPTNLSITPNINKTDPFINNGKIEITVSGGTDPLTYELFDENSQTIGTGNSITGLGAGIYTVEVTDANGCVDIATIQLNEKYPPMENAFPNIFTPNGDDQNDLFKLINPKGIQDLEIIILNRWGNVVFENNKIVLVGMVN